MNDRIGELLGRIVPLSGQDVAEILEEQKMSHRKFGQIALSWGLCQPEQLWQAWCDQMLNSPHKIDLDEVGLDTQALQHVPREIATACGVIPVRALGDRVVVAMSDQSPQSVVDQLPFALNKSVQFVLADAGQIAIAIDNSYPHRRMINPEPIPMRRTA